MSRVMRAIRVKEFGGPEVLKVATDVPMPKPGPNEVLVQVKAAGVNPVDTYFRAGLGTATVPFTPGNDGAGVVTAIGEKVTRAKVGQRVYFVRTATGAYADYALVDEDGVAPLSDKLTFSQGASIGVPYFTAYRALIHKAQLKPGNTVLVHGASGAVGVACCQIGQQLGIKVIGTAGTSEGLKLATANGASHVFNHRETGYTAKILAATEGGQGVDAVVEMLANVNLETDLTLCKNYGCVVIVGSRGSLDFNPRLTMVKELSITGLLLFHVTKEELAETASFFHAGQEAGWLSPVVDKEFPLAEAPESHHEVIAHSSGTKGKIVLVMDDPAPKAVPL